MEETDVQELGSATQPATPTETTAPATDFTVPDEYKESGWAANIKSVNDLWTQHANAQKLIGKKTIGIPTADSSEQEIEDFYAKIRPETLDGYDFDLEGDTDFFKDIFHKNGISSRQAKGLVDAYKESVRKQTKGLYSAEGFEKVMKENLGEDYKPKLEKVNGFLKQFGSKSALEEIENLPNETLGLVYNLINLTMDKYAVKELGSVNNTTPGAIGTQDLTEYMKEMKALDSNPFATNAQRQELRRKYGIIK